jgi:tRNA pseudouridine(55) synthase
MRFEKKSSESVSGIVLLAKKPGMTSFSSLWAVKHALKTEKVGHTGTLDSFAEGLLVVLTGRYTRLVSHITGFTKTYRAVVEFGTETDTLDPTGQIVKTGVPPAEKELRSVLPQFRGDIEQIPPAYSAIHVDGRRASDLARGGAVVELCPRLVHIFSLEILDFSGNRALIEVTCSKGTYIRSLARDIAYACGSCAHLIALRRTAVGSFSLSDAPGAAELGDFTLSAVAGRPVEAGSEKIPEKDCSSIFPVIQSSVRVMTPPLASACGLEPVFLVPECQHAYALGRPLTPGYFKDIPTLPGNALSAVFYPDGFFGGLIKRSEVQLSYEFVIPPDPAFMIYRWEDILSGTFSAVYRKAGTALSIGSFDGPHIGHDSLFNAVLQQEHRTEVPLVPGVVTFTRSLRGLKNPDTYKGDVATLAQRLEVFRARGFKFVIVIDFSSDFGKIKGTDFLSVLVDSCGMRFLAEGCDFRCGYNGAVAMDQIRDLGIEKNFQVQALAPVLYEAERVSSSRIRERILAADFRMARYMLNRAYAVDCSSFEWTSGTEGTEWYISAEKNSIQVLPPEGSYNVLVIMSDSSTSAAGVQTSVCVPAYRTMCKVGICNLRLQIPSVPLNGSVQAIQFGDPEDLNSKE